MKLEQFSCQFPENPYVSAKEIPTAITGKIVFYKKTFLDTGSLLMLYIFHLFQDACFHFTCGEGKSQKTWKSLKTFYPWFFKTFFSILTFFNVLFYFF